MKNADPPGSVMPIEASGADGFLVMLEFTVAPKNLGVLVTEDKVTLFGDDLKSEDHGREYVLYML